MGGGEAALSAEDRAAEARLLAFLDRAGIPYALHRHRPVFTVEEAREETGLLPGAHTKNLFLRAKDGALVLATCLERRRIRIADLEKAIGARKLSFGPPDILMAALGVRPGSVTALAVLNDPERRVRLVLDSGMMREDPVNLHPLHNAATLALAPAGLRAFLAALGRTAEEADFDAMEALAAARARAGGAAPAHCDFPPPRTMSSQTEE